MEIISQVEIDILTGETRFLQTDIIYDCGQSLNPAVDLGQVSYWLCKINSNQGITQHSSWNSNNCFY